MRIKKITITITLIILCAIAPYVYLSHASLNPALPAVSFNPSNITGVNVGSSFSVSVQISDVTNLWGWTITLSWDPSILQMQGAPTEGPFLKTAGSTLFVPVGPKNDIGTLEGLSCLVLSYNGATGSGNLTKLTFNVIKDGACQIKVTDSEFDNVDSSGNSAKIPVTVSNATFANIVVPSPTPNPNQHGPKAIFTPTDGSFFKLGTTIQLNATSSQLGADSVNGLTTCPIINYAWRVEYQNGTTLQSITGVNPTFTPTEEGTFRIILIVTATDPNPPSDPSFQPTDSTSATIQVYANPQDTQIDVNTDNGGIGQGTDSNQYGPLQVVQIYASVKNHINLVPNQNVVFSVKSANQSVFLIRQATTNQSGIATTQFRLPSPDPSSPVTLFGKWSITASVNNTNTLVNDTTSFNFNYLSGLHDVQIPTTVHKGDSLPIFLGVDNTNSPESWSELSLTVFDQAGIAIGSSVIRAAKQFQNITIIDTTLTIPSWAFTGQATVYFCLLTNSTTTQKIPLAPESIATFQILP